MPPQYGLYAALVPIVLYALLGTSPHLAIGPVAISAILILAGVGQLAEPFTPEYIELVILAGLLIGVAQMILGLFKMGRFINLLSYPVITGFTSAASIIVISSQLKDILGLQIPRFEYLYETIMFTIKNIGETHLLTFGIALISFLGIFILKRVHRKIPGALVVVVLGILFSYFFDMAAKGVDIIGLVPSGLPSFDTPTLSSSNIFSLLPTVILVTIIGIVESIGIAKALENKNQSYEINTNQELLALGVSKIGGAFFAALPSSGSFSRSALLHENRAKTTVASIITVLFVMLALLFLTPYLFYLPKVILAVIIIYAVKNLFEYNLAKKLFQLHTFDFEIMMLTFLVTLLVSIEVGVGVGFLASFIALYAAKGSFFTALRKVLTQNFKDEIFCTNAQSDNCICEVHVKNNVYFGNVNYFKDAIKNKLLENDSIFEVTIQCDSHVDMDSSGIKGLIEMTRHFNDKEISYNIKCPNQKLQKRLRNVHIDFHP